MNKAVLVGRLTATPEIKLSSSQKPYCNFTVAVDRRFKDANGNRKTDFINCVAWNQTAQFIQKYFSKGSRIGIVGTIQTRYSEDQNGQKHYITEVLAEEVEFVDSAKTETKPAEPAEPVMPAEPAEAPSALPFEV